MENLKITWTSFSFKIVSELEEWSPELVIQQWHTRNEFTPPMHGFWKDFSSELKLVGIKIVDDDKIICHLKDLELLVLEE